MCMNEPLPARAQWEWDPTRPGRNIQQEPLPALRLCLLCWVSFMGQHLSQPGSWWHQVGQCACGTLQPLPRQAVAHPVESRLYLSVPGLQQSLRIPNSALSPFSPFIIILWHPRGDSQPWRQVVQRSPESQGAASGISRSDPRSPTWGKTTQETLHLQNRRLIDSPCSRECAAQLFNSHLGHLSMFSYHRVSLSVS